MTSKPRKAKARRPSRPSQQARPAHISAPVAKPPSTRRQPSQERARKTVDAIIEAAGQVLVAEGRAAVTTNAVAERAGVSIGSLYQYFPDKEAIFAALQTRHRGEVMPLIHHALARLTDPTVDMVESIVALMRAMVDLHSDNPARMRALVEELDEGDSSEEIDSFVEATMPVLAVRMARAREALRPTAWLLCTTVRHVGRTLVHAPPELDIETLLQGLAAMLRGLLGAESSRPRHETGS